MYKKEHISNEILTYLNWNVISITNFQHFLVKDELGVFIIYIFINKLNLFTICIFNFRHTSAKIYD